MSNYYEIFIVQFIKTLAQLSAGLATASVAVPMYSYYVKGKLNLFDEYYHVSDNVNDSQTLVVEPDDEFNENYNENISLDSLTVNGNGEDELN